MATHSQSGPRLVELYDEIVAASSVLSDGTEKIFGEFLSHQIDFYSQLEETKSENYRLKAENEAKDIKLKMSRHSHEVLLKKRTEVEMNLKQYEKQFTIIKELLGSNERMGMLNDAEKRSLAFLKESRRLSQSPGSILGDSCDFLSDVSMEQSDQDLSRHRNLTKWKRRRTLSGEGIEDTSLTKKQRGEDGMAVPSSDENDSLTINKELVMTPPLERQFKKPRNKNRRKPSTGHLRAVARSSSQPMKVLVPPLAPKTIEETEVVPSAPPEEEVVGDDDDVEIQKLEKELFTSPTAANVCSSGNDGTPLNSLLSPRIYPDLDAAEDTDTYCTPLSTPSVTRTQSDINLTRHHVFITKTLMKPGSCEVCHKKIGFGKNCMKCKDCRAVCHIECKNKVPLPCVHSVSTPKKMKLKNSDLACFCPNSIPRVPSLVVHCVKEIEQRGLTSVGLYRIPGNEKAMKELKERLLKAKGTPNLSKVDDINVVCGCLKDFLRSIREPIITYRLHPTFLQAVDQESDENVLAGILEAVANLPPCNKDTLAFLILHLQRVSSYSDANKMPVGSLAKVFGPTIVGYSSPEPRPSSMWRDTQLQPKVMERLLSISGDYWRQYLSPEENPEPQSPTPSTNTVASPATPEPRPIPESPFLGSLHAPKTKKYPRTPVVTRSSSNLSSSSTTAISHTSSKKTGGFFAALN